MRTYARKSSQAQTVTFNTASDAYAVAPMPDLDRPDAAYSVNLAVQPYLVDLNLVNFNGTASVQFDIYGRPNNSGSVIVKSGSRQYTVQVDAAGNVSIQ